MKRITTKDIMNELLTIDEQVEIETDIAQTVARIRGGKRENSGRKALVQGKILKFTKRVTEEEAQFIDYARKHHIDYNDLMEG